MQKGPKIFIITERRSGSHHLMDIICNLYQKEFSYSIAGEVYNYTNIKEIILKDKTPNKPFPINNEVFEYTDEILSNHLVCSLHLYQIKELNIDFFKFIEKYKDSKFIILNRINKLEQYISLRLAAAEELYSIEKYNTKFGLGLDEYYKYAKEIISDFNDILILFEKSSVNPFTINYNNEFSKDNLIELCKYLEIEFKPFTKIRYTKQRDKDLSEYLTNPEVLKIAKTIEYKI